MPSDALRIVVFGRDHEASHLYDAMQERLAIHPRVGHVDFVWVRPLYGVLSAVPVPEDVARERLADYDLIFTDVYGLEDDPLLVARIEQGHLWKRVVLFDAKDDQRLLFPQYQSKCLLYVKRSYDPFFLPQDSQDIIAWDLPLLDAYLTVVPNGTYLERDCPITCTLPQAHRGAKRDRMVEAVRFHRFVVPPDSPVGFTQVTLFYGSGWVTSEARYGYRTTQVMSGVNWWTVFMHLMARTQILFTAPPPSAQCDNRTWEAFASGALVCTTDVPIPQPNPMRPWDHYIPFDLNNIPQSFAVIDDLLCNHAERQAIAARGKSHAVQHHSSTARIAYLMDEILQRVEAVVA